MQWMLLQQDQPEDSFISTGMKYGVRKFINCTAEALGMQLHLEGKGVIEVTYRNEKLLVPIDPRFY